MTTASKGTGLASNLVSTLCYICMPVSSIIFMLLEEKDNKDVQFHAWQSTTFGMGYLVVLLAIQILSAFFGMIMSFLGVIVGLLVFPLMMAAFILWVVCLVKAYQGERWKIPYIGDFAEKKAGLAPTDPIL